MSWLGALAGKAEDLLNKIDNTAATALHQGEENSDGTAHKSHATRPTDFTWDAQKSGASTSPSTGYSPYLSAQQSSAITSSASVPSNLNKMNGGGGEQANGGVPGSQMSRSLYSPSSIQAADANPTHKQGASPTKSHTTQKKHKDEDLFDFLNSAEVKVDTNRLLKKKDKGKLSPMTNGAKHSSRQSSGASTPTSWGAKTPVDAPPGAMNMTHTDNNGGNTPPAKQDLQTDSPDASPPTSGHENEDLLGNHDSSSGYHSSGEETANQHLSSLDLENKLLRQEVESLNQEMQSVIHRAHSANEELQQVRQKLEHQNLRLSESDQLLREAQSRESDFQEVLGAKDSQLAVLRVRLEEADKELVHKQTLLQAVETQKDRILADHTSASDVHSQALDTLKEKLSESELSLRQERESHQKALEDSMTRHSKFEAVQQSLSDELSSLQKKLNDEKAKSSELTMQLKTARSQVDLVKQELQEYKDKATRILQSKDKLISSLKEGSAGGAGGVDGLAVSAAELEEMRGERDLLREEVTRMQMSLDTLRQDMGELEVQMQQDGEVAQDQVSSLEESLQSETRRREDAESECTRQKQELRFAHEELVKQKSSFQSRLQDRESEISRLRAQLTTRSMSSSSQQELENRLRVLTESLIEKQTMLESLGTEKNSLALQLERMEKQCREAEACALRASSTAVHINEDDEVRQRLPGFMRESPMDGDMTRRVKRAANTIDKFGVRLGVFLRRYPIARVFVILYMILLHLWVMIVLLTYQPEIHGSHYQPQPPSR